MGKSGDPIERLVSHHPVTLAHNATRSQTNRAYSARRCEKCGLTLATAGFQKHSKLTRRAAFLAEMEQVVPWRELCAVVEPFYPKPGNGRPPVGLERMLRLHLLQHWFNLSDPAVEEALCDSIAMRRFVGIDLGREPVPDETTILNFRHLLERHD